MSCRVARWSAAAKGCDQLLGIPKWIVHNTGDQIVAYEDSQNAVTYLNQSGESFHLSSDLNVGNAVGMSHIFTSFDREGHDAWTPVYNAPIIYQWLLSKRRASL